MKTYRPDSEETDSDRLNRLEEELVACRDKVNRNIAEFHKQLGAIEEKLTALLEIAEAWNSLRGFAKVMTIISSTIKTLIPIALLVTALVYFFKTGTWTWGADK